MVVILNNGDLLKDSRGYIYELNNRIVSAEVKSLKEASQRVREYIDDNCLGSSTFTGGDVYEDGNLIAKVSYNGRVWDLDNNEINVNKEREKMNKKFMLISIVDRELMTERFDTYEEAYAQMKKEFEQYGGDEEKIEDGHAEIKQNTAWLNNDENYDWQIIDLENE